MSDDHTLIVIVTGDTEDVLTQLSPTPLETAAEVGATWVARWCRGASLRTSIDTLSWNAHTVQMAIRLDPTIHERLIALARERQRDPVDMASAIINATAADLLAAKRRGFLAH
jgi:hypothetical protein